MAGKFNMKAVGIGNGMLSELSQSLKENLETVNINIDDIVENEKNKYSVDDIDDLIDSIKTVGGIKQNLDVMKIGDGKYKLLTGHRRLKALKTLAQEDKKYQFAPCSITELSSVHLPISDDMKEQYLINITNSTQRNMTEADVYNQYLDLKAIYTEAKNNGFPLTTKMRNLIANDMKVSPAQIGKMDYIHNNASAELKERLNNNEITVAQANEIAHESKEVQATIKPAKKSIVDSLTEDSYNLSDDELNNVVDSIKAISEKLNGSTLDKKSYAKFLKEKDTIMKSIDKINKL